MLQEGQAAPSLSPRVATSNPGPKPAPQEIPAKVAAQGPEVGSPEVKIRGSDRRVSIRLRFPHKQYVAPYHGGCLPTRASFKEVACQDISSTGFSFLSSQPPDFESLVVALGVAPNLTYMTARVINRVRIADAPAPLYRIGCRFSGRLS